MGDRRIDIARHAFREVEIRAADEKLQRHQLDTFSNRSIAGWSFAAMMAARATC
jgi:hypothetical protein